MEDLSAGEQAQTTAVHALPPSDDESSRVSFESRYLKACDVMPKMHRLRATGRQWPTECVCLCGAALVSDAPIPREGRLGKGWGEVRGGGGGVHMQGALRDNERWVVLSVVSHTRR